MTTTSPQSPYILFPNEIDQKYFALKTQPFYSIFYNTNDEQKATIRDQVMDKATPSQCKNRLRTNRRILYQITNDIPFNLTTVNGKKNLFFLLIVFLTTIVLGTITFYYWSFLLGNTILDPDFRQTMESRSLYLSVLFFFMFLLVVILFYEFFTLKTSSLHWLRTYQSGQPYNFYNFVMNTRKIVLWVFMIFWLSTVIFITITISQRRHSFKNLIAINILSGVMLLTFQYLYYNTSYQTIKTFSIFSSAFIIGLTMFLLYGL